MIVALAVVTETRNFFIHGSFIELAIRSLILYFRITTEEIIVRKV